MFSKPRYVLCYRDHVFDQKQRHRKPRRKAGDIMERSVSHGVPGLRVTNYRGNSESIHATKKPMSKGILLLDKIKDF